jgi:hypothetical protein
MVTTFPRIVGAVKGAAEAFIFGAMGAVIKVNGWMILNMVWVYINGAMERCMKESIFMTKGLGMELQCTSMGANMRVNGRMMPKMGLESTLMQMEVGTKGFGKMTKSMGKEPCFPKTGGRPKVSGKMGKKLKIVI